MYILAQQKDYIDSDYIFIKYYEQIGYSLLKTVSNAADDMLTITGFTTSIIKLNNSFQFMITNFITNNANDTLKEINLFPIILNTINNLIYTDKKNVEYIST